VVWPVPHLEDSNPAAGHVGALLETERPIMSWINLGEVFDVIRRAVGEEAAAATLRDLRDLEHPMAYADAFAAATAIAHEATLWTGDPELLVGNSAWSWRDLR
jgi:hypothetical protein